MELFVPAAALIVCAVSLCASPPPRGSLPTTPIVPSEEPPRPAVALPGDPDDAALAKARLQPSTCGEDDVRTRAITEELVATMRARVEQNRLAWTKTAGVSCAKHSLDDPMSARGNMWGDTIGESFGAGGLGLSGAGQGGGGAGQGFGLGGVGTVHHAANASKTNNQVEGVDEGDLVKNDGSYIYLATGRSLRIVRADEPTVISKTSLDGYVRELFVSGDRVVAYVASAEKHQSCTYGYDCELGGDGSSTDIVVLDVADRVHPRVVRKLELSGSLIAARRIGDTIHTVVSDHETSGQRYDDDPSGVPWCGVNAKRRAALRPKWDALVAENERKLRAYSIAYPTVTDGNVTTKLCDVLETPMADGKAFTTIVSFELQADAKPAATRTIRSRPGTVFASESGLYLAVRHDLRRTVGRYGFFDDEAEVSDIHKFRLGAKAEATQYVGSGVVAGHVLNQLSMDEWHGALRVATTRGRVPDPSVESAVSTFVESPHGNLLRVGAVLHLAPHEDIRAVRFDDDRGYVVTFKKTDPLFVLDLKSTTEPRVLGELKIPGFSTYLHRIDPTHLLSIGYDADDHGEFAYFGGLLLQLFDVEDPLNPRLLHRETIGSRGSSSEAAGNHLAFTFDRGRNLLAIPATVCDGGGDGTAGDKLTFSGLLVYAATAEKGFRRLGGVDHGTKGASCDAWWSNPSSQVKRSLFLDDRVFSIAENRMKVQSLKHLGTDVASIGLKD